MKLFKGKIYDLESDSINVVASNSKVLTHLQVENFNGTGETIEKFSNNSFDVEGKLPICTVIGFPNGYQTTAVKVFETNQAVKDGADEIDMVINLGMLKEKL